jgi:hypothetical protein
MEEEKKNAYMIIVRKPEERRQPGSHAGGRIILI